MINAELMAIAEAIKLANRIIDANPESSELALGMVDRVLKIALSPMRVLENKSEYELLKAAFDKAKNEMFCCSDCAKNFVIKNEMRLVTSHGLENGEFSLDNDFSISYLCNACWENYIIRMSKRIQEEIKSAYGLGVAVEDVSEDSIAIVNGFDIETGKVNGFDINDSVARKRLEEANEELASAEDEYREAQKAVDALENQS